MLVPLLKNWPLRFCQDIAGFPGGTGVQKRETLSDLPRERIGLAAYLAIKNCEALDGSTM